MHHSTVWVCACLNVHVYVCAHMCCSPWSSRTHMNEHSLVNLLGYLPIQERKLFQIYSNVMYAVAEKISNPLSHLKTG